jgi:hypothetical protein
MFSVYHRETAEDEDEDDDEDDEGIAIRQGAATEGIVVKNGG